MARKRPIKTAANKTASAAVSVDATSDAIREIIQGYQKQGYVRVNVTLGPFTIPLDIQLPPKK